MIRLDRHSALVIILSVTCGSACSAEAGLADPEPDGTGSVGGTTGGGGGTATNGGSGSTSSAGRAASAAGGPAVPELDCGPDGWAVENHGPPSNRVNYLILADGYTAETVNTTLVTH